MTSIIISGMPASGKTTIAKSLAKEYNLRLLGGGDILKDVAISRGYKLSGEDWWDTDEGMKFLEERKITYEFDKEVDQRLIQEIELGNIVITSYTIPWLTKKGIKIWLEASITSRAKRLASRDRIGYNKALKIIEKRDMSNIELYQKIYGIDLKDLSVFNHVIETNILSKDMVIDIVRKSIRLYI